jgi:hypothetical protein
MAACVAVLAPSAIDAPSSQRATPRKIWFGLMM